MCAGSLLKTSDFQSGEGGSHPAPALQFSEIQFSPCSIGDIAKFIIQWHYSKSVKGVKTSFCFKMTAREKLIGAAIFGGPAMPKQWQKYTDCAKKFLELRRLCAIDDTPKNVESWFIGKCLRFLKKNSQVEVVLSYSDLSQGHQGTIYRASNFRQLENVPPVNLVVFNGKKYHYRTSREIRNGKFTKLAEQIQAALLNKSACYEKTKGKHTYLYKLR